MTLLSHAWDSTKTIPDQDNETLAFQNRLRYYSSACTRLSPAPEPPATAA